MSESPRWLRSAGDHDTARPGTGESCDASAGRHGGGAARLAQHAAWRTYGAWNSAAEAAAPERRHPPRDSKEQGSVRGIVHWPFGPPPPRPSTLN